MRIAVDARTVYSPRRRGTGKNLIDLYTTLAQLKRDWQFVMYHQPPRSDDPFAHLANVRAATIDIPGDRYNLWQDLRLPTAALADGADVLHCPANTAPLIAGTPIALTIHDLIPLEIAPGAPETRRWLKRVGRNARQAREIITPSRYSRDAIVKQLGVAAEHVTVNYWAPDRGCTPPDPAAIATVRATYRIALESAYLLAFGADDPRKNTAAIIRAWGVLSTAERGTSRLLIVGCQAEALARLQALAAVEVPDRSCLLHGFAPESEIPALIGGASALVFPSLSEGFGLPIVDAFACGTPVITSRTTSLPEIAGDAALLVDPRDIGEIGRAMATILNSPAVQEQLRGAGRRRLPLFSWDRCAANAADVLERAAGRRTSPALRQGTPL